MKVSVQHESSGRPYVVREGVRLPFDISIAHSGHIEISAISTKADAKVGIDIEFHRHISIDEMMDIVKTRFSPMDYLSFLALNPDQKKKSFFRAWTQKEAVIKCLSLSLEDIDKFSVEMNPELETKVLCAPFDTSRMRLQELAVDEEYTCVLALWE